MMNLYIYLIIVAWGIVLTVMMVGLYYLILGCRKLLKDIRHQNGGHAYDDFNP